MRFYTECNLAADSLSKQNQNQIEVKVFPVYSSSGTTPIYWRSLIFVGKTTAFLKRESSKRNKLQHQPHTRNGVKSREL